MACRDVALRAGRTLRADEGMTWYWRTSLEKAGVLMNCILVRSKFSKKSLQQKRNSAWYHQCYMNVQVGQNRQAHGRTKPQMHGSEEETYSNASFVGAKTVAWTVPLASVSMILQRTSFQPPDPLRLHRQSKPASEAQSVTVQASSCCSSVKNTKIAVLSCSI